MEEERALPIGIVLGFFYDCLLISRCCCSLGFVALTQIANKSSWIGILYISTQFIHIINLYSELNWIELDQGKQARVGFFLSSVPRHVSFDGSSKICNRIKYNINYSNAITTIYFCQVALIWNICTNYKTNVAIDCYLVNAP